MHTVLAAHANKAVCVSAVHIVSFSSTATGECFALLRILVLFPVLLGLRSTLPRDFHPWEQFPSSVVRYCGERGEPGLGLSWLAWPHCYSLTSAVLLVEYGPTFVCASILASSPLMFEVIISVQRRDAPVTVTSAGHLATAGHFVDLESRSSLDFFLFYLISPP